MPDEEKTLEVVLRGKIRAEGDGVMSKVTLKFSESATCEEVQSMLGASLQHLTEDYGGVGGHSLGVFMNAYVYGLAATVNKAAKELGVPILNLLAVVTHDLLLRSQTLSLDDKLLHVTESGETMQ